VEAVGLWFETSLDKSHQDPISKASQVWWDMPIISTIKEAELEGSQFEVGLGKNARLCLRKH
jgi:hypothetical protein